MAILVGAASKLCSYRGDGKVLLNKLCEQVKGEQMTSVWSFPICSGKERLRDSSGVKLHPTQKSLALLRRIILATSRPGDTVLDPFLGSGTTVAAAKQLGRIGVGIEREKKYITVAKRRIKSVDPEELSEEQTVAAPRRVAFAELLKHGLIKFGQHLQSKDGKTKALVLADGNIKIQRSRR